MSDKTMIGHRKPERAGTKIGWAPEAEAEGTKVGWPPEAMRQPAPPYPARSFVLQDDPPDLGEQPTILAPQRRAHGSVPPPYASELDGETTLAAPTAPVAYAQLPPTIPAVAYAQLPLAQPKPQPKYPIYPRASRFCEATAEILAARSVFVRRTYVHLYVSLLACAGVLYLLTSNDVLATNISARLVTFGLDGWNWTVVLGAYMAVSWIADFWARHTTSRVAHYLGLGVYSIAVALILMPLLAIVESNLDAPNIVRDSAMTMLTTFTMLTTSALLGSRRLFLRSGLAITIGAGASLGAMSLAFGFDLGLACSAGVAFLGAMYVLVQTSELLEYRPDRAVAGALVLFASIPLVVWSTIRACVRRLT